jgi:hypothetical protein
MYVVDCSALAALLCPALPCSDLLCSVLFCLFVWPTAHLVFAQVKGEHASAPNLSQRLPLSPSMTLLPSTTLPPSATSSFSPWPGWRTSPSSCSCETQELWTELESVGSVKNLAVSGPPGDGKSTTVWAWALHAAFTEKKTVTWFHCDKLQFVKAVLDGAARTITKEIGVFGVDLRTRKETSSLWPRRQNFGRNLPSGACKGSELSSPSRRWP